MSSQVEQDLDIPDPMLWDVDTPNLYHLKAVLVNAEGRPVDDEVVEPFGMRKIEVQNEKIFLNGKPIYLRGALSDQDFLSFYSLCSS